MRNISNNGLYQVIKHRSDDDSYFYSYTSYSWYVISVETGDELMAFYGSDSSDSGGRVISGVQDVYFHDIENILIVEDEENKTQEIEMPVRIWLTDKDKTLNMEYKSGKIERRERREAIATTKYGQPLELKPPKNPTDNEK